MTLRMERQINHRRLYIEQIKELAKQGMSHDLIIETFEPVMSKEEIKEHLK